MTEAQALADRMEAAYSLGIHAAAIVHNLPADAELRHRMAVSAGYAVGNALSAMSPEEKQSFRIGLAAAVEEVGNVPS